MLTLLSPAKNLDFKSHVDIAGVTAPRFQSEAKTLAEAASTYTPRRLQNLMDISPKLAALTRARFESFLQEAPLQESRLQESSLQESPPESEKPAIFAFNGEVYQGLDAKTLGPDDLAYGQNHLRILSGLYGVLRPLDAIRPYRLEMGSKLKNPRGGDLYAFWGDRIAKMLAADIADHRDRTIVNLASIEYFSAVDQRALGAEVVTPIFKEEKGGALRQLQFFAKRARGMMARWIIRERIDTAHDLAGFDVAGYRLRPDLSEEGALIFARKQPPLKSPPRRAA
jgi:hypothetical protein